MQDVYMDFVVIRRIDLYSKQHWSNVPYLCNRNMAYVVLLISVGHK